MAMTARMTKRADDLATKLSYTTGKDKAHVIELALEKLYHEERMRLFNEAYSNVKSNGKLWKIEEGERSELEGTLLDGLEE